MIVRYGLRLAYIVVAWAVGFVVYLVAAIWWGGYDGCISFLVLPIMGVIASSLVLAVALAVGSVLRRTRLDRLWRSSLAWPVLALVASVAVMLFGSSLGLTYGYVHPDTSQPFEALHPVAGISAYLLLVFAVAHWPLGRLGRG